MLGRKCRPTRYGSKVVSIDDSAAKQVKGYLQSVVLEDPSGTVPGWVMVIAETYPAAIRATELVQVVWQNDDTASVSDKDLRERAQKLIADKTAGAILDTGGGDIEAAFAQATTTLDATYTTAGVLHFQLEPVNALAFQKDGRLRNPYRQPGSKLHPARSRQGSPGCRPRRSSCAPTSSVGASGAGSMVITACLRR